MQLMVSTMSTYTWRRYVEKNQGALFREYYREPVIPRLGMEQIHGMNVDVNHSCSIDLISVQSSL